MLRLMTALGKTYLTTFIRDNARAITAARQRARFTLGSLYFHISRDYEGGARRRADWMIVQKMSAKSVAFWFVESAAASASSDALPLPAQPLRPKLMTHNHTGRAVLSTWCRRQPYETKRDVTKIDLHGFGRGLWRLYEA
jgi:hypothetical protein